VALITCEALTLSELVLKLATPLVRGTGPPLSTPSTWNWTSPVGAVLAGGAGETVAVKVTFSPNTVGLFEVVTVVVVLPLLTVSVKGDDVLLAKFPSVAYEAVMERRPPGSWLLVVV
jgi:hypothetical protein